MLLAVKVMSYEVNIRGMGAQEGGGGGVYDLHPSLAILFPLPPALLLFCKG